ncbi:MAG: hypothetical protein JKY61_08755 [Planctomycetes bacterium]|nr:hypothetical protein [Planctomycetota bacterium]
MQTPQTTERGGIRLHLGCGADRREGWLNVDVNPQFQPDMVAVAHDLPMLTDASCIEIESCHLFEHLTLTQARAALREWRRLLAPGGKLQLELPNLTRCIALIGTELDSHDLGMLSLFGYPPEVDEQGEPQTHKWGWTPESLAAELHKAGFENIEQVAISQTTRPAAKFDRDMRLVATVSEPRAQTNPTGAMQSAPSASQTSPTAMQPDEVKAIDEVLQILAWPRYDDGVQLDDFFRVFARVLSGRDDVNLNLRIDPQLDPSRDDVIAALDTTHARILGPETTLNVTLLEGELSPSQWAELSPQVACRISSPQEAAPRDSACLVNSPVVSNGPALFELLNEARLVTRG